VIVPLDSAAERQLVMVGVMESNDRGMTISRTRAEMLTQGRAPTL
jgi:hypothetical protein